MNNRNTILLFIAIMLGISVWYQFRSKPTRVRISEDTLMVGTNTEFQPFSFFEKQQIVGYDIDVITEVARRMDKKIIFQNMPFDALITELQLGNIQVIAAGMTPSEERAKRVLFSEKIFDGDPLMLVTNKKDSPIQNIQDLHDKNVIVNEGYTADMYISQIPEITVVRLATALVSDGLLALQNNRGNAFIASKSSLQPYFNMHTDHDFKVTPIDGTQESDAFAISRKQPELARQINDVLNSMRADGTIQRMQEKWGLL